jgi:hypothetical protein
MRAVFVVVRQVLREDLLEVTTTEDEEPVETLSAGGAYESLGDRVRRGDRTGVSMILMPSVRNTSSKLAVNFASLSRTRNLTARERSGARGTSAVSPLGLLLVGKSLRQDGPPTALGARRRPEATLRQLRT